MTSDLQTACRTLRDELPVQSDLLWFRAIGIGEEDGENVIVVYVEQDSYEAAGIYIPDRFGEFRVVVRFMSDIVFA